MKPVGLHFLGFFFFLEKKMHVKNNNFYYDSWLAGSVEGGGPTPLHAASPVASASLPASPGSAATSSASAASTTVVSDSCAAWVLHPLLSPWGCLRPHLLLWRLSSSKKIDLYRDFAAGIYRSLYTGDTVSHVGVFDIAL